MIQSRLTSKVLITSIASALIALLAYLAVLTGLGVHMSYIILGAMIDLVPGVAFVNSVREFSQNNFSAGMSLLMGALLTCISMAAGVTVMQMFLPGVNMVPVSISDILNDSMGTLILHSLAAGLGTIAFGMMFRVRVNHFVDCGVLGSITWMLYLMLLRRETSALLAIFASSLLAVMAARLLAMKRRCPMTVFLMTSLFPLLPGISFYRAVYYMPQGNDRAAMSFANECFLSAFTIAVTIAVVQEIKLKNSSEVRS